MWNAKFTEDNGYVSGMSEYSKITRLVTIINKIEADEAKFTHTIKSIHGATAQLLNTVARWVWLANARRLNTFDLKPIRNY